MLHKQHVKEPLINRYYCRCRSGSIILWIFQSVNSKFEGWVDFAMLFTLKTMRKAGELQIPRCQGIAVDQVQLHP